MAGREVVKRAVQQVRPVLSVNKDEAKRRVLSLYKAWYRQAPYIGQLLIIQSLRSTLIIITKTILPFSQLTF